MTASAQGIDVSSYQAPLTGADLAGRAFAFTKATNGATGTDPNFAANWAAMKSAKVRRGAYCELVPAYAALAEVQAAHFIATVKDCGAEPGDMLAVVSSDYAGVTGTEVKAWLDTVKAAFPGCAVLVYSDLTVLPDLADCTAYPLWVAYYSGTAPQSVAPWGHWTFWQYQGTVAPDNDAFNGTSADLDAYLESFVSEPRPYKAPAGLSIPATVQVPVSWQPVEGASSYFVQAYPEDVKTPATGIVSVAAPGTSAELTLTRGRKYKVSVWAEGPKGAGTHAEAVIIA